MIEMLSCETTSFFQNRHNTLLDGVPANLTRLFSHEANFEILGEGLGD